MNKHPLLIPAAIIIAALILGLSYAVTNRYKTVYRGLDRDNWTGKLIQWKSD